VVRAPKDGYTLFLSTPSEVALNALLYSRMPYDPLKDLSPISLVAIYPNVMVVNASVPASTVNDLIALAKKTQGGLHYGSSGTGSTQHLAGEWLSRYAGFNWVHVPYKGAAPATTDIVGGQIPVAILGLGAIMPHIKSGRLRAITVVSTQRSAALPDVPTLYEAGIKFDATQWYGILTTAGAPAEVVAQVNAALKRASAEPAVRERLIALGGEPATSTPEEYTALIRSETEKFAKIVQDAGIKAD
jgi:tripartite-type tricarboxylate transporter receptor subunit TctC